MKRVICTAFLYMLKTIEGIYQNGKVEFAEQPPTNADKTAVLVTFLDASVTDSSKLRQLIDQLETIAGLQQGFEELITVLARMWCNESLFRKAFRYLNSLYTSGNRYNAGHTRPIDQFINKMQQKYGISS
jgi:hypothetical protein